ncbi:MULTISPECIES: UvrD-helicase domain-containing protein [unclassified Streptomyces]|uniref:UvrD-helicase domain-containing protein n=1 Tax=unclassified Streptomyces TaxID=2593676 RepID=UPI000DAE576F|nr:MULTISPECIES: UvrD-helicase domain-containing protein [unclassified Streptomyces]PZT76673.1 DNA helicase [Streptomyces sp. AC1-42W]PZT79371.1 DNA helicase [Streptomyces sp. AC1-42T]
MTVTSTPRTGVTLRLLDKADKEIVKLDRAVLGAFYKFQHDFRRNPDAGGLDLKPLEGHDRLWSARVNREWRALMIRLGGDDWLLVSVKHRSHVHKNLDRFNYGINHITGAIEYVDLQVVEESLLRRGPKPPAAATPLPAPVPPPAAPGPSETPLFAAYTDQQLADLGVTTPLIPIVRKLTTDDELLGLAEYAPRHTGEVLLRLRDGVSYDTVMEQVTAPVAVPEPERNLDADDWRAAVDRSQAVVITDDESLQSILEEGDFGRWKVFLHPTQEKLVHRRYSGPARVGGGPGTGKTIVALHRVCHLVGGLSPGHTKPVLLTTFNRNLAADLRARLLSLGGPEVLARVDIAHVDQLATRIVSEADPGNAKRRIDDATALREWRELLVETGETRWSAEFLSDEWNQVILGQAVTSRSDYFTARRAGRGRSVTRAERAGIWQLAERFTQRLETKGLETHRQVAERAAKLEMARKARIDRRAEEQEQRGGLRNLHVEAGSGAWLRYRYRHIVVDEAQDLSAAHWKMLRAMVPAEPDDIFLVGDTHQRIYDNQVTLGSLGVHIRGRSSRLTLSYRTTREILRGAVRVLDGAAYDDLDGAADTLAGYRSVLHGTEPSLRGARGWEEEMDLVVEQLRAWHDVPREATAICVPTNDMVSQLAARLVRNGITPSEITQDGPRGDRGVNIGTMYRFKGLEYRCLIIAGAAEGLVPRSSVDDWEHKDPSRHERELHRARSLLFVAATRARDALAITWHGEPSRFLAPLLPTK